MEIVNDDMNVPSTTSLENNNKMMVQENMQVLSPSTMIPVNDVLLSTQGEMSSFNKQQPSSIIGKKRERGESGLTTLDNKTINTTNKMIKITPSKQNQINYEVRKELENNNNNKTTPTTDMVKTNATMMMMKEAPSPGMSKSLNVDANQTKVTEDGWVLVSSPSASDINSEQQVPVTDTDAKKQSTEAMDIEADEAKTTTTVVVIEKTPEEIARENLKKAEKDLKESIQDLEKKNK